MSTTPPAVDFGYRRRVIGRSFASLVVRRRSALITLSSLATLLLLGLASLANGDFPLDMGQVVGTFTGTEQGLAHTVVHQWRLPRTLAAVAIGAALGVSGAIFQTLTRNPLASPDIVGLSHGAFTGMLMAVLLFGASWSLMAGGAVVGGVAAALVIYVLAYRGGLQGFRFIVVGIAISAMLASVNTWILLQVELETAMFASAWGAGTLNGVTQQQAAGAAVLILALFVATAALAPGLRQLDLGDDAASAIGIRINRVRILGVLIGVGLVCASTAVAGPIAFVALAAPQIAQRAARTPYLPLAVSACFGAVIVLASDFIAQHLLPGDLPVGVVTVVVGGSYLVWIIIREIRKQV